jgi:hypothetical protein
MLKRQKGLVHVEELYPKHRELKTKGRRRQVN